MHAQPREGGLPEDVDVDDIIIRCRRRVVLKEGLQLPERRLPASEKRIRITDLSKCDSVCAW